MASVIWDVGLNIKTSYMALFKLAEKAREENQEELAKGIEEKARDLKNTYIALAKDHGWI